MSLESIESCRGAVFDLRPRDKRGRAAKFSIQVALAAETGRLALSGTIHAPGPPVSSRCRRSFAKPLRYGQLNWALE